MTRAQALDRIAMLLESADVTELSPLKLETYERLRLMAIREGWPMYGQDVSWVSGTKIMDFLDQFKLPEPVR